MLFALFSLISFKLIKQLNNSNISFIFTFQVGGNYSININGEGKDKYILFLSTTENMSKYWIGKDKDHPCDNISSNDDLYLIQLKEGKANISEGRYTINLKKCNNSSSKDSVEIVLMNPNSCLSADDQNVMNNYKYIIIVSIIFYVLWLINWFYYFSVCNFVHLLFTLFFLFKILSIFSFNYELQKQNKSDEEHQNFLIQNIESATNLLYLFITSLNICYYDVLPWKTKNICLILCFVFSSITVALNFFNMIVFYAIILAIEHIFYMKIYSKITEDNSTTYTINLYLTLFYLYFFCRSRKEEFVTYYQHFLIDIVDIIIYIAYGFIFRMKKDTFYNYFRISNFEKISSSIFHYPFDLTKIEEFAFFGNQHIKKIIFDRNSNVEIIGQFSFARSSLQNILIPSSVTQICESAFQLCSNLKKTEFQENSKLERIDKRAFRFSAIEEIIIPSSVLMIDKMAFSYCKNLKKISFSDPSNLQIIGEKSFCACPIKCFTIKQHVNHIDKSAFENCTNLLIVEVENNSELRSDNLTMFNFCNGVIIMIPS